MAGGHIPIDQPLDKWIERVQGSIDGTLTCIDLLESGKANFMFLSDWVCIYQIHFGNESLIQYLEQEIVEDCNKLLASYEAFERKYNPYNEENNKLSPRRQDEIAKEIIEAKFDDPELVNIHQSKLSFEKKILESLQQNSP